MEFFQAQFPTPTLRRAEAKLRSLLRSQLERHRNPDADSMDCLDANRVAQLFSFAKAFHAHYEKWQAEVMRQQTEPIQCGAGCSNCCQHYPMSVELFEGIGLYMELRNREDFGRILEECYRRVQIHASIRSRLAGQEDFQGRNEEEQEDAILHEYFSQGLRCPLLDDQGLCSAHMARPVTCRMYFSYTDPQYCTPEHLQSPKNRSFHVCLPDVIEEDIAELGSAYADGDWSESLYELLLQLNAHEGNGIFP